MTFSELLALDKMPHQTASAPRPAPPNKTRKHRVRHHKINHDTMVEPATPVSQAIMPPRHPATETPRHHVTMTPAMLKPLRQAVRQIGKEAATYRFTREEKNQLTETIYTQSRAGIKTCENEIVRIAVNWLIADHRARGETSVLSQALTALRE
jgi:hypothetical protein